MTWRALPKVDTYAVRAGRRYAVTCSVSKNFETAQMARFLSNHGWSDLTLWNEGEALPSDWPGDRSLTDDVDNHRLVRGYGRADVDDELSASSPWPTTIYRIRGVWLDDGAAVPVTPPPSGRAKLSEIWKSLADDPSFDEWRKLFIDPPSPAPPAPSSPPATSTSSGSSPAVRMFSFISGGFLSVLAWRRVLR